MKSLGIKLFLIGWLGFLMLSLAGCGGGSDNDENIHLQSLKILPIDPLEISDKDHLAIVGLRRHFIAVAYYSDGSSRNVTSEAEWKSSDTSIMEPVTNHPGTFDVKALGDLFISASYKAMESASLPMATISGTISLVLSPQDHRELPVGLSLPFKAKALVAVRGTPVGTFDVSSEVLWRSSDTGIARMEQHRALALAAGTTTISASLPSATASTSLSVVDQTFERLVIRSIDGKTKLSVPQGTTHLLSATLYDTQGNAYDVGDQVNWHSSDPRVVSVGKEGAAKTFLRGGAVVSATFDTLTSNSLRFDVLSATLQKIYLSPQRSTAFLYLPLPFHAWGYYSDGSLHDISRDVDWMSSNAMVADINTSRGIATGYTPGTTTISATLDGVTSTTPLTISSATIRTIQVATQAGETNATSPLFGTERLQAIAYFSDGHWQDITRMALWESSDPTIGSIDGAGVVQTHQIGNVRISATYGTVTGNSTTLRVGKAMLMRIVILPPHETVPTDTSMTLRAKGVYRDGSVRDISRDVHWTSNDIDIATIDPQTGQLRGISQGKAEITAALKWVKGTQSIQVEAKTLEALLLFSEGGGTEKTLPIGTSGSFHVMARYSDGEMREVTDQVSFLYDNTIMDRLTPGRFRAIGQGTGSLRAYYQGITSNDVTVTVTGASLQHIEIQPTGSTLYWGEKKEFIALGTFSDGSVRRIGHDLVWQSSDPLVATVRPGERVRGTGSGLIELTTHWPYDPAIATTTEINVTQPVLISMEILDRDGSPIDSDNPFIVGETARLQARGDFSDGTQGKEITEMVSWSTDAGGKLRIDPQGMVTTLEAGRASVTALYRDGYRDATITATVKGEEKTVEELLLFSDPDPATMALGQPIHLEAWARYTDGATLNVSDTVQWRVDTPSIALETLPLDKSVRALATAAVTGTVTATDPRGISASKTITFNAKIPDHLELQEGYCADGSCRVIGGETITIPIVDHVQYHPATLGAYYPSAWLIYQDGSRSWLGDDTRLDWSSSDPRQAYLDMTEGPFVFGRMGGNLVTITAAYEGRYTGSFYVNVEGNTSGETLQKIALLNTKIHGWHCPQDETRYGGMLKLTVGESGRALQACGQFKDRNGSVTWKAIGRNVLWSGKDPDRLRVSQETGAFRALNPGETNVSANYGKLQGSIGIQIDR